MNKLSLPSNAELANTITKFSTEDIKFAGTKKIDPRVIKKSSVNKISIKYP